MQTTRKLETRDSCAASKKNENLSKNCIPQADLGSIVLVLVPERRQLNMVVCCLSAFVMEITSFHFVSLWCSAWHEKQIIFWYSKELNISLTGTVSILR